MQASPIMQLFESDLMVLPKALGGTDVRIFLQAFFERYQRGLDDLGGEVGRAVRPKRTLILLLCKSIISALTAAVDGVSFEPAIQLLDEGLEVVREDLLHVARKNEHTVLKGQSLYRLRRSPDKLRHRREMFHAPFGARESAPTRYSLRHSPCLYLANSIYTCWTECRLPDIESCTPVRLREIYASRFELKPNTKVLDMCYPPWAVSMALRNYEEDMKILGLDLEKFGLAESPIGPDAEDRAQYLTSYLTVWPISLAISLLVQGESDGKKPEYVIPQILMAWVQKSTDFAGIRYFSTRECAGNSNYDYAIDYAFPAKSSGRGGRCDFLRSIFRCTKPLAFGAIQEADITKHLGPENFTLAESKFRRYIIVYEKHGIQHFDHYYGTLYCNMEYHLDDLDPEAIEDR